ncbi:MAG: alpha/beta hydrolase [Gammaproteobacteria bacterium]
MKKKLALRSILMTVMCAASGIASAQVTARADADVARAGMPDEIASALASIGRNFNGAIVGRTAEIYASAALSYDPDQITVERDVAYGPDERQRFDIHVRDMENVTGGAPVIVLFHGGGLAGGSRASMANAAGYFASIGYVAANATYRLAPVHAWPAGAQDVGNAVTWLRDNVGDYGGDPEQIFVMGISSGALHSATYVFMPDLLEPGTARPAGAILMSGPYTFDFDNPSTGERGYFGDDAAMYTDKVVVGNVRNTNVPVIFTTAEYDIDRYTVAFTGLMNELTRKHGISPRYAQSLGHNHTSQVLSIGTTDTGVSSQIIDFIERTIEQ